MSDNTFVNEIGDLLSAFVQNATNADLIARARSFDWQNASLEEREALNRDFMANPDMKKVVERVGMFGFASSGIGGLASGSFLVGGGGGGGILTYATTGETKSVGFAFGSAGASVSVSADFAFLCYRDKPSEFYGLFHGAYAQIHAAIGLGVYTAHCGAGWDSRWEAFIFAVGIGAGGGAGGFVGGAWNS